VVLESSLEKSFHGRIRAMGGESYKLNPSGAAGLPDRLVLLPGGRLYLVELKADTGALRPVQRVWHERAAELGTTVVVLKGADEIAAWLAARAEEIV
jgi:hypothetical protein